MAQKLLVRGRQADGKVLLERLLRSSVGVPNKPWARRQTARAMGPNHPEDGRTFSKCRCCVYTQYREYERSMVLCNSGQSIKRLLLTVSQLLLQSTRKCLSCTYFDGTELHDHDVGEALAKHTERRTDVAIEPSIAAASVCRMVATGTETTTAVDRMDACS
ncbi:unnamed protein product [Ectocarpus sp. CCAP 1310/34]|nr:unnamed protein product [Ectocarpus sp. CCAP 1310/34]